MSRYTDDAVIGAEDNDCADASLGQQLYCRGKVGGRVDCDDVAAPSEQNVLDDHGSLPGSENDPPRRWSRQENDSAAQKRPTPIAVRQGAVLQSVPQIV